MRTRAPTKGSFALTLALLMNKAAYTALPDDLRAMLDAETGANFSKAAAQALWANDPAARQIALDAGNAIHTVPVEEIERWKSATSSVLIAWADEVAVTGVDGWAMVDDVRYLIDEHRAVLGN